MIFIIWSWFSPLTLL